MADKIILGLDPGTRTVGYGLIRKNSASMEEISHGEIEATDDNIPARLHHFYNELEQLLDEHTPDVVVVEEAFYGPNAKATLRLGEARGTLILAAARRNAEIEEYTPTQIKKAVTGNGAASKKQVNSMVKSLLGLTENSVSKHATDALAASICYAHRIR